MPNGGPLAISRNRLALSGWCVAVLLLAVPLVFRLSVLVARSESGPREVIDFIFDDGYYYLAIAANLADTGHSTLDGLTATNGYQPLWLLVLTALGRIVGTRGWTFFVASCALIYAIAICTPLIALSKRRGPCGPAALALGAALAFVLIQQSKVFLEGLEPILIPPLAIPLVLLLEGPTGTRQTMLLSLVLAAMFLVRLDALALTGASFVVLALARPTPGSPPAA